MQQPGFLNKLYEIKPFKIVESPENPKKLPTQTNPSQFSFSPYQPITIMSSVQPPPQSSSNYSSNAHKQNTAINLTPTKNNSKIQIQLRGSNQKSSQRFVRKYSIQQPCSPNTNNFQKAYTIAQNPNSLSNTVSCSPIKTPNKQNILPVGTMIESHLYTSLSSSIDTLFTKIEKIKQQFQPNHVNYSDEFVNIPIRQRESQKRQTKDDGKYKMIAHQSFSQISGHSPILKARINKQNEISSMSSFSPLQNKNNVRVIKEDTKNYINNRKFLDNMYKQNSLNDLQSMKSFEPVLIGLPQTHTQNINEMSNKTKSIIDQINLLLDSNKKNNPYFEKQKIQKQKNSCHRNVRKAQTLQSEEDEQNFNNYFNNPLDNNYKNNERQHNVCHQYDQLDDQFVTIKLKPMQSECAPQNLFKTKSNSANSTGQEKKKINCTKNDTKIANINFNFKIQQPISESCNQFRNAISETIQEQSNKKQFQLSMRDFQLGKCVGSGKFGDVHICKHKATGFIFALKKVFKSTIIQYQMINQFIQQLKIHYTLSNNHPNITKLYTHFQDQYHIFLLMEYIQDGTLMCHLKKQQEFVSNIVFQVLNAVQYLHRNNIAHRDIKPENILYTNGVAKICDFGWSSHFKDEMKKTFCGTLDYISPEMKDKGEYTTTVDLWSIGVLTFELLTGFPPYKKQIDKWRIMGSKLQDRWRWDVLFPPQISDAAQVFIQKLLKQNPDERISIRECRKQQFITKFNKQESQESIRRGKEFYKILS